MAELFQLPWGSMPGMGSGGGARAASFLIALLLPFVLSACGTGSDAEQSAATADVPDQLPEHPHQLAALTTASTFPRFTAEELAAAGYPDHRHAFTWNDWQVMTDAEGRSYGPGHFCAGMVLQEDPALQVSPGDVVFRNYRLVFHPEYEPCQIVPFLELLDWARRDVQDLLGFSNDDSLTIYSADNTADFRQRSEVGTWRLYILRGDDCLIQSVPVLRGRTLIGHAAFRLLTQWTLRGEVSDALPPWLEYGLAAYVAEDGVHLNNYTAQFRPQGNVLLAPPIVDTVLSSPPDQDPDKDRKYYRLARYSAFLMVWELVEHRGGLEKLRRWLHAVAAGEDIDTACRAVYGMGLDDLARELDPVQRPEPLGNALQARTPDRPPVAAVADSAGG